MLCLLFGFRTPGDANRVRGEAYSERRAKKTAGGRAPRRRCCWSGERPVLPEAHAGADAEDPRAGDLTNVVRGADRHPMLALQAVRFVEDVEAVHAQGEAEVAEGELLLHASRDDVAVVEPEA